MMDLNDEIESYSPQSNPKNTVEDPAQNEQGSKNTVPLINSLYPPKQESQEEQGKPEEEEEHKGCCRFCTFEYYEKFFQVSQDDIMTRLRSALVPPYSGDFMEGIKGQPDLYGPVWVTATLVLLMGFINNFSNYLLSLFVAHDKFTDYFFELELIRKGAVVVYVFGGGVPLLLYLILKCVKGAELTFPQVRLPNAAALPLWLLSVRVCACHAALYNPYFHHTMDLDGCGLSWIHPLPHCQYQGAAQRR